MVDREREPDRQFQDLLFCILLKYHSIFGQLSFYDFVIIRENSIKRSAVIIKTWLPFVNFKAQ